MIGDIIEIILVCCILVITVWVTILYCKSDSYDSDDDWDETTY